MSQVIVRQFTQDDQKIVSDLYAIGANAMAIDYPSALVMAAFSFWFMHDKLKPEGDMRNIYSCYVQNSKFNFRSNFFVATIDNQVVGFVGAIPSTAFDSNMYVEITRMFVDNYYRGKGVAGKLLTAVEEWAGTLNYQYMNLGTLKENHLSIPMYQKNGFQLVGEEDFDMNAIMGINEPPQYLTDLKFLKPIAKVQTSIADCKSE